MQIWMKITQRLMIFIRAWVTSSQCWADFTQPLPIFGNRPVSPVLFELM